jgi:hypothetical protein
LQSIEIKREKLCKEKYPKSEVAAFFQGTKRISAPMHRACPGSCLGPSNKNEKSPNAAELRVTHVRQSLGDNDKLRGNGNMISFRQKVR